MTVIDHPQERAWAEGESSTVALMGTINVAVARLVATIGMLIDTGGWGGHGIQTIEHWVTWKAGVSRRRAEGLVRTARRVEELLDPDPNPKPEPFARERFLRMRERPDGSGHGEFSLPPDEMAQLKAGLQAARDAELLHGLEPDAEVPEGAPGTGLTWADALVSAWPRRASTRSTRAWPAPVAAVSAPRWSCTTTSTPTAPSGPTSAVACRLPSAERVTT